MIEDYLESMRENMRDVVDIDDCGIPDGYVAAVEKDLSKHHYHLLPEIIREDLRFWHDRFAGSFKGMRLSAGILTLNLTLPGSEAPVDSILVFNEGQEATDNEPFHESSEGTGLTYAILNTNGVFSLGYAIQIPFYDLGKVKALSTTYSPKGLDGFGPKPMPECCKDFFGPIERELTALFESCVKEKKIDPFDAEIERVVYNKAIKGPLLCLPDIFGICASTYKVASRKVGNR